DGAVDGAELRILRRHRFHASPQHSAREDERERRRDRRADHHHDRPADHTEDRSGTDREDRRGEEDPDDAVAEGVDDVTDWTQARHPCLELSKPVHARILRFARMTAMTPAAIAAPVLSEAEGSGERAR